MKVDKLNIDERDKVQSVAQVPVKTESVLHRIKPFKGHTLFEINLVTGKTTEAEYESVDVDYIEAAKGELPTHKKVLKKEGCLYISALNKRNALKKFLKNAGKAMCKMINK